MQRTTKVVIKLNVCKNPAFAEYRVFEDD